MTSSKLLWLLIVVVFVVAGTTAVARKDPELQQCREQCRDQEGFREEERRKCEQRCEEYVRRRKEESGDDDEEYGGERAWEQSPYVFKDQHFDTIVQTEQGRVHVLKKFTERSKLLKGIENYRVGFLEANPGAFLAPLHLDADVFYFVAKGKPSVTLLREEKKETFNLEVGDILHIPAGTPIYGVNRDDKEKLFIIKFFNPVSLPGRFEPFHFAGAQDPETFYTAFSGEVLSAALKRDRDEIERLFRQQKKGSILRASKEQIEELSRHAQGGGGGIWPFHEGSKRPFSLFRNQRPVQSNRYGSLFEATSDDFKQLQHFDLTISFVNITRGSMVGPYYNSKATKISFVVDGDGYVEMACPHLQRHGGGGGGGGSHGGERGGFRRVSARLNRGTVLVVPAGHPVAAVASPESNLQVVCFEVFAKGNVRYPLAGKNNVVTEMDNVAKELSFGVPAREVERIFRGQNEEFFFPGPTHQGQGGTGGHRGVGGAGRYADI